jgi:hypothetical protein
MLNARFKSDLGFALGFVPIRTKVVTTAPAVGEYQIGTAHFDEIRLLVGISLVPLD